MRIVGDENGEVGRNSTVWSPIGSGKEFGFYSKGDGEPLKDFKQKSDTI